MTIFSLLWDASAIVGLAVMGTGSVLALRARAQRWRPCEDDWFRDHEYNPTTGECRPIAK